MSFYLSLPSNSVSSEPENTTTCYKTSYIESIRLSGSYEVALVEAIYNLSWFLPVGNITYSYSLINSIQIFEVIPIVFHDGDTILIFIEKINKQLQEHILKKKYNERYDLFRENANKNIQLKNTLFPRNAYGVDNNTDIINDIKSNEKEYIQAPMLRFANDIVYIQFLNKSHSLQFHGQISDILKTIDGELFNSDKSESNFITVNSIEKINASSLISLVGTLYIYTDIIEYQLVGSTRIPLLRNVVLNYDATRKTTWVHYDSPHYIRVNQTEIRSILVDIRDQKGNKILFESGEITLKLHFRPIKNSLNN